MAKCYNCGVDGPAINNICSWKYCSDSTADSTLCHFHQLELEENQEDTKKKLAEWTKLITNRHD